MERIISEFRLIETEDGYRLEIKGDKEAMRKAMGSWRHPWHRGMRGFPFPPFGFGGPWRHHHHWSGCCESDEGEEKAGEGQKGE